MAQGTIEHEEMAGNQALPPPPKCKTCGSLLEVRGLEYFCITCGNYVWGDEYPPLTDPNAEPGGLNSSLSNEKEHDLQVIPKTQSCLPSQQFKAPEGEDMPAANYKAKFAYCRLANRWGEKWLVYFRIVYGRYLGNEILYPIKPPPADKQILSNANLHKLVRAVCQANGGGFSSPTINSIEDLENWLKDNCEGLIFRIESERVLKTGKGQEKKRPYSRVKSIIKCYKSNACAENTELGD